MRETIVRAAAGEERASPWNIVMHTRTERDIVRGGVLQDAYVSFYFGVRSRRRPRVSLWFIARRLHAMLARDPAGRVWDVCQTDRQLKSRNRRFFGTVLYCSLINCIYCTPTVADSAFMKSVTA